jgi:IMP dehydrogenase
MAERNLKYVRDNYGPAVKIGAGNVVDEEGFNYLAESGPTLLR